MFRTSISFYINTFCLQQNKRQFNSLSLGIILYSIFSGYPNYWHWAIILSIFIHHGEIVCWANSEIIHKVLWNFLLTQKVKWNKSAHAVGISHSKGIFHTQSVFQKSVRIYFTKKTTGKNLSFFWLPQLGSNQWHHD